MLLGIKKIVFYVNICSFSVDGKFHQSLNSKLVNLSYGTGSVQYLHAEFFIDLYFF